MYTYQAMCAPGTFPHERSAYLLSHVCTRNTSSGKVCILTKPCVHQEHFLRKGLHTYQAMCAPGTFPQERSAYLLGHVYIGMFLKKDLHTYQIMCAQGVFPQERSAYLQGYVCTRNISAGQVYKLTRPCVHQKCFTGKCSAIRGRKLFYLCMEQYIPTQHVRRPVFIMTYQQLEHIKILLCLLEKVCYCVCIYRMTRKFIKRISYMSTRLSRCLPNSNKKNMFYFFKYVYFTKYIYHIVLQLFKYKLKFADG